jgi:hypothetical protein
VSSNFELKDSSLFINHRRPRCMRSFLALDSACDRPTNAGRIANQA